MPGYWWIAAEDELLVDLDNYKKPVPRYVIWGEMWRQRLRDAINAGRLNIRHTNGAADVFVVESNSENHYHAFIRLAEPMELMQRMVWQLRLASDWKRAQSDLMRAARGITPPSLLIRSAKVEGLWREPDFECSCVGKHETLIQAAAAEAGGGCPVWKRLRGATPWELFGAPAHSADQTEMAVNIPLGRVPLEKILEVGKLKT